MSGMSVRNERSVRQERSVHEERSVREERKGLCTLLTISEIVASKGSPRMRTITSPPLVRNTAAACMAPAGPERLEI